MLNLITNSISNLTNLNHFNQFINHKVEVTTRESRITFNYYDFNYDICDNDLILMEKTDKDCRVYIPVDKITSVTNLTDDLYTTVVDIKYKDEFGDKIISICCAERRPIPVRCDRCGYVFSDDEQIWYINQQGQYGSVYDGDWVCKRLCDSCVEVLMDNN